MHHWALELGAQSKQSTNIRLSAKVCQVGTVESLWAQPHSWAYSCLHYNSSYSSILQVFNRRLMIVDDRQSIGKQGWGEGFLPISFRIHINITSWCRHWSCHVSNKKKHYNIESTFGAISYCMICPPPASKLPKTPCSYIYIYSCAAHIIYLYAGQ